MEDLIRELYAREVSRASLDFDADPEYQSSLAQAELLCPDGELPPAWFHLLDRSNFLSSSHGLRLGMRIVLWGAGEFRRSGGDPLCQQRQSGQNAV